MWVIGLCGNKLALLWGGGGVKAVTDNTHTVCPQNFIYKKTGDSPDWACELQSLPTPDHVQPFHFRGGETEPRKLT